MGSFWEKLKSTKKEEEKEKGRKVTVEKEKSESFQLNVDVYQSATELVVYAQTPGVEPEDLEISLEGDTLVLEGEIKIPPEIKISEKNLKAVFQECRWGKFSRKIVLPQEIDLEGIEAKLKKGVLFLKLPFKSKEKEKRRIVVKAE